LCCRVLQWSRARVGDPLVRVTLESFDTAAGEIVRHRDGRSVLVTPDYDRRDRRPRDRLRQGLRPYQFQIVEWVIETRQIMSRNKGLFNFAVGVALARALSAFVGWHVADWSLLVVGALASIIASVEAATVHDGQPATKTPASPS
jgi:hypothetical protein